MKILEDFEYTLDDVVNQINSEFGFSCIDNGTPDKKYVLLGDGIKLYLDFKDNQLSSASLDFPSKEVDVLNHLKLDIYSSSIESSAEIVNLITRMLGGKKDNEDT